MVKKIRDIEEIKTNKQISKRAVEIAIKYLRKKYPKKKIVDVGGNKKEGCDLKIGNDIFVEVKGTGQEARKKGFFYLSENEFRCACKHKRYYLLWVNTKTKKIQIIDRDEVLRNTRPSTLYFLNLTESRRKVLEKE
jgi:hypothetical protein